MVQERTKVSSYQNGHHLSSDELADVLQPRDVLLLLLVGNVVGDHGLELNVKTTLLEVAAPESNQLGVQVLGGRAGVEALAGPVLLSGLGVGGLGILKVGDLLNLEVTVLDDSLDQEGAVGGLLNGDSQASGEGGGQNVVLALELALVLLLVGGLVGQSVVGQVVHGVLGEVVDIGDSEGNTDAIRSKSR